MKTKIKFGPAQVGCRSPLWAKYTFRVIFLLLSFGVFMVSDYPGISDAQKFLLLKWFSGINMLAWGLSKMFGVEIDPVNPENAKQ